MERRLRIATGSNTEIGYNFLMDSFIFSSFLFISSETDSKENQPLTLTKLYFYNIKFHILKNKYTSDGQENFYKATNVLLTALGIVGMMILTLPMSKFDGNFIKRMYKKPKTKNERGLLKCLNPQALYAK